MFFRIHLFAAILLVNCLAEAHDESYSPVFSPPDIVQKVGDAWTRRTIQYAEGVEADVVLSVDQNLYDLLLPLIQRYASEHHLKIVVQKGTCGISAGKLSKKQIDVGGYCCPPGHHDRLPGLVWHTLGIMPIAVIVHPDNPVTDLTLPQLRSVFKGDLFDWKQVYAAEYEQFTHPVARLHCKLRPGHWRLLLNSEDEFTPDVTEVAAIEDMIRMVSGDVAAIGYEVPGMLAFYEKAGRVKEVTINGVSPGRVAEGEYPLYRVYNLTTWRGGLLKNNHAEDLVHYLMEHMDELTGMFVPADVLRQYGWTFFGDELVGAPESQD